MNPLRKNIHILTILWAALSLAACTNEELVRPVTPQEIEADPGSIVLTLPGTARALSDGQEDEYAQSTEPEAKIARIDVLVFPDGEDKNATCVFHKRFTADNDIKTTTGTDGETTSYVVMAHKSEFNASQEYKVYVLANANSTTRKELDAFLPTDGTPKTLADLKTLVVTTERVYLTGIDRYVNAGQQNKPTEGDVKGNIPRYFMMDATATSTDNGTSSTVPTEVEPLTLNDGNLTEGMKIYATLRRAAAKVTLILNADKDVVKFPPERGWLPKVTGTQGGEATETTDQTAAARFQLIPTNIRIDAFAFDPLTGAESDSYLPATADLHTESTPIFVEKVGTEQVSTWTYAYPHRWEGSASTYAEGSYLVVRVPIFYKSEDGTLETNPSDATWNFSESSGGNKEWTTEQGTRYYTDNYYKIPMGKDSRLERNTHYVVTGTISAPGSTQPDKPLELTNIAFQVVEWQPENINIGEDDNLHFLYVNKNAYTIRNVQEDHTLTFSSSHPVTITVQNAYFIDKEGGIKGTKYYYKDGKKEDNFLHADGKKLWDKLGAGADITAFADDDGALSGGITLKSPVPTNNLPRIIELKIENDKGDTEYVTITQYPLDWIQYTEGVYSYWDDYEEEQWSTYEYKRIGRGAPRGQPYTGASRADNSGVSWSGGVGGIFSSKYVNDQKKIVLYKYNNRNGTYVLADGSTQANLVDYRMYHIQITSTSDEYVIGRPKLNDGHTVSGEDNAQMVSPSFMINSQLGATSGTIATPNQNNALEWAHSYADHYAEVFIDSEGNKRVYRDWRLPTAAELRIISKFQGTNGNESDAMFIVANGYSYWTASGVEINGAEKDPDGSVKPNFPNASPYCLRLVRDVYDGEEDGELVRDLFSDTSKWRRNN